MRRVLIALWLLMPVAAGAYHYGPGQDQAALDDAFAGAEQASDLATRAAQIAAESGDEAARVVWMDAFIAYEAALLQLPADQVYTARRLRLELAKTKMMISKLPEANADLEALVEELAADPAADAELFADARQAMANSQYYMTWLMRLEGLGREEWEPQIEGARQTFKLLALAAEESGDADAAESCREDLESAVRLARMDLDELQGLPLPSQ